MRQSEKIDELALALARAQGEMKNPPKDKTAEVQMKAGGKYSYNYSDLATVIDTTRPVLSKHGLSITQIVECAEGHALVTKLMHASGQWIESVIGIAREMSNQEFGGQLTYLRRYMLCAILGIASDDDTDAQDSVAAPSKKNPVAVGVTTPIKINPQASQGPKVQFVGRPITQPQFKRLMAICGAARLDYNRDVKPVMLAKWGVEKGEQLNMEQYDQLVGIVQAGEIACAGPEQESVNVADPDSFEAGDQAL